MVILYGFLFFVSMCVLLFLIAGVLRYERLRRLMPRPTFREVGERPEIEKWDHEDVTVTWIGHSTLYINFYGTKILTDPVFDGKIGVTLAPGVKIGMKRYTPPALRIEDVKDVDVILLSHAHMDHFDMSSLKALGAPHIHVVTATNTKRLLRRFSFGAVTELGSREEVEPVPGLRVKAFPVKHWGNRFPWNTDYGFNGYMIEKKGRRLVFSGDTAWTDSFKTLRDEGPIDWIAVPIGAYSPDSFQGAHCTPEQAWQMAQDSGAHQVTPIHWNTFVLSQEPVDEPIQRFIAAAGEEADRIVIREQGQVLRLDQPPTLTGGQSEDERYPTATKKVSPSVKMVARSSQRSSSRRTILD
ncbi:MBL fold metallo-hydrolase [Marininema halotolerans]|uniref:L-ascorbate metabolism protein UlaG, beta-lactamase superfamily n=1 Tax=Marininema halotolerans TaxID=1155944 RepID=A0A1I6S0Z8_9BACL|nr:MBL fold metallo-hydrolase [Marininema halotolerans]SFS70586.1 L-ascorbate metabolism protein UlaG, beta-lactamase superfamily [Marininema halotolerans]